MFASRTLSRPDTMPISFLPHLNAPSCEYALFIEYRLLAARSLSYLASPSFRGHRLSTQVLSSWKLLLCLPWHNSSESCFFVALMHLLPQLHGLLLDF